MKKVISIAVCAAVLGLVGCSSGDVKNKADAMSYKESISQLDAAKKCKHKKCRHHHAGKLGEEKTEKDTAK